MCRDRDIIIVMDKDSLQDLKQFIEATVSQQLTRTTSELRADMKQMIGAAQEETDMKLNEILNALGETTADQAEQLKDHERRITKLEHV